MTPRNINTCEFCKYAGFQGTETTAICELLSDPTKTDTQSVSIADKENVLAFTDTPYGTSGYLVVCLNFSCTHFTLPEGS